VEIRRHFAPMIRGLILFHGNRIDSLQLAATTCRSAARMAQCYCSGQWDPA